MALKCFLFAFLLTFYTGFVNAQKVIQLYSSKAPASKNWNWEEKENTKNLFNTRVVYNVAQSLITAYLPNAALANGNAVIIAPGGTFYTFSIESEGIDVAKWLNAKGVAAFVLNYRLVPMDTEGPIAELMKKMGDFKKLDEGNDTVVTMAVADGLKAMEYVRSHAAEYNINPKRIGIMGFSAGGTVTMGAVFNYTSANRPDFAVPFTFKRALMQQVTLSLHGVINCMSLHRCFSNKI